MFEIVLNELCQQQTEECLISYYLFYLFIHSFFHSFIHSSVIAC